jgi:rod shape determining protein RodA
MLINVGMVIGVLPVVGITLPFVSYGGSSLIALCLAIGLIENVSMRRYIFQFR